MLLFTPLNFNFQPTGCSFWQATQMKVPSLGDAQVTSAAPQSKHWRFSPVLFNAASSPLSLQDFLQQPFGTPTLGSLQWMTTKCNQRRPGLPVFNVFLGVAVANLAPTKFCKDWHLHTQRLHRFACKTRSWTSQPFQDKYAVTLKLEPLDAAESTINSTKWATASLVAKALPKAKVPKK